MDLRLRTDLVTLFVGETGHGKSTMVNSLMNYIAHKTYDEAVGHLVVGIPQCWRAGTRTWHTRNWLPAEMEVPVAGSAGTGFITNYAMDGRGVKWRFIDTPGFADPRGVMADRAHTEALVASFSTLTQVDAIVIVVKGGLCRATPQLKYVIGCIFSTLPKSITRNIIFAVTCCGEANGDDASTTIATFQALLTSLGTANGYVLELNRNVFVFENKCFVTCTEESGTGRISDKMRAKAVLNWEYARVSALKMFQVARSIPVFTETRQVDDLSVINLKLVESAPILVQLEKNTANLVSNVADVEADIVVVELAIATELPNLRRTRTVYTAIPRVNPRSTCVHEHCTTQSDSVRLPLKVCHDNCHLEGIQGDTGAVPGLKMCDMFHPAYDGLKCTNCEHGWESHVHVYVDYTKVMETFDDPDVRAALQRSFTRRDQFIKELRTLREKQEENRLEKEQLIQRCSAGLVYLRQFSCSAMQVPLHEKFENEIRILEGDAFVAANRRIQPEIERLRALAKMCRMKLQEMERGPPGTSVMPEEMDCWLAEGRIRLDERLFAVVLVPHPLLGREWTLPPVPAGNRPTGVAPDQPAPAGGVPGAPAPGNGVGDALEAFQVHQLQLAAVGVAPVTFAFQAPRSSKPERAMQQIHHHLGASDRKGVREATFF